MFVGKERVAEVVVEEGVFLIAFLYLFNIVGKRVNYSNQYFMRAIEIAQQQHRIIITKRTFNALL